MLEAAGLGWFQCIRQLENEDGRNPWQTPSREAGSRDAAARRQSGDHRLGTKHPSLVGVT